MRKPVLRNGISLAIASVMVMSVMAGCGKTAADAVEIPHEDVPTSATMDAGFSEAMKTDLGDTKVAGPYFQKGVYVNYAAELENPDKNYFYVFDDDGTGHIDDGAVNTSMFFTYEEGDGVVYFHFGSEDPIDDTLTIKSVENGFVTGCYEGCYDLVFEPVSGADADTFSAVNFVSEANGEHFLYEHESGWSVKYDPSVITVNGGGPLVTFVYTGESAGTNMVTVTYDVGKDAKTAAADFAKQVSDKAEVSDAIFPGTEDVKCYYVNAFPGQMGPGMYESAYVRDYMDGYLMFECTDHMCGQDEIDIPVSDALAEIIDSVQFKNQ